MRVQPHSIIGECETGVIEMPLEGLQIGYEGAKLPRFQFTHPGQPGWSLFTFDKAILEKLLRVRNFEVCKQVREINRRMDDMKRLKVTLAFLAGFLVFAIVAMNVTGWLLGFVVQRLPVRHEIELGKKAAVEVAQEVDFVAAAPTNEIRVELVKILGNDLAARYPVHVAVYESFMPNAFVLPGGYFYVSTGLLDLAETPEELAGVLAHEAAHLKLRHGLRSIIAGHGHGVFFKWMFGGSRNLVATLSAGADLLVGLSYSREMERQADDDGWDILLAANINPHGIITLFEKLESMEPSGDEDGPRILQTHPPPRERIERMKKKWEESPKKSGFAVLKKIEWHPAEKPAMELLKRLQEKRQSK